MFFTSAGKFLAYLGFAYGIVGIMYGFSLGPDKDLNLAMPDIIQYMSHSGARRNINTGVIVMFASVALGVLSEISASHKPHAATRTLPKSPTKRLDL